MISTARTTREVEASVHLDIDRPFGRRGQDLQILTERFVDEEWTNWKQRAHDEGRAEAAARAVLTVLRVGGIAVPDAARERILAQKDPERLERWHERSITATSVDEAIDESS
jgi:hypothetical protein